MTVLADVADDRGPIARSPPDAPAIDGVVVAIDVSKANVGAFLAVKIVTRTSTTGMRDLATRRR